MADSVLQLVARLESTSGLAEDSVENVLHIGTTGEPDPGDVTLFMQEVRDFFLVDSGAGQSLPIGAYIGETISRAANKCHVLAYWSDDLSGATPFGAPIGQLDFSMTASGGGDPFPEEVAMVISYHGDLSGVPVTQNNPAPPPAIIRPQQRRRGRMYVGPLNTNASTIGGAFSRPSNQFRIDLKEAFTHMAGDMASVVAGDFGVWSRADEAVYLATAGWVDNAWDIQRRRGAQATAREAFTI